MNRLVGLLVACAIVVVLMPSGSAQTEQTMSLQLLQVTQDPSTLRDGRLPTGATTVFEMRFEVRTPPIIGKCPFTPITVTFTAYDHENPRHSANLELSETHVSRYQDPFYDGPIPFQTSLSITLLRDAPAFETQTYAVKAVARAGAGMSGGCNLKDSWPLEIPVQVVPDYRPGLEVTPQVDGTAVVLRNTGNGGTQVQGSWGTAEGWTGAAIVPTVLENPVYGPDVAFQQTVDVDRAYAPADWDGRIQFVASSVETANELDVAEVIMRLPLEVRATPEGYDEAPTLPGFELVTLVGAAAIGLMRRRARM